MSKSDKYSPNYETMYPGISKRPEVLAVLKSSDRKMKYFERDLKQESKKKVADGEYITIPSREDSVERLHENAVQFASEGSVHEHLEKKLLREALIENLEKLPPQQRDLIKAHYYDGKTQKALAMQYGISRQSVGYTIQKGLEELGKVLKDWKN